MTAQVLFFMFFSERDPHLNAVEKERLRRKACERCQNLPEEEEDEEKSRNMVASDIKIFLNTKNQS